MSFIHSYLASNDSMVPSTGPFNSLPLKGLNIQHLSKESPPILELFQYVLLISLCNPAWKHSIWVHQGSANFINGIAVLSDKEICGIGEGMGVHVREVVWDIWKLLVAGIEGIEHSQMMQHSVAIMLKSLAKIWQHLPRVAYWKKNSTPTHHQVWGLGGRGLLIWRQRREGGGSKMPETATGEVIGGFVHVAATAGKAGNRSIRT